MTESARSARGREAERRGRIAELLCLIVLRLTGWRVRAHRLMGRRGSGLGEIDIVAERGGVIAFIEVKARRSDTEALEAVGAAQRARIQSAAQAYLGRRPDLGGRQVRFDVMILSGGWWPRRIADAWRVQ